MRLTSRSIHLLATNPRAQQEFIRTGRVPGNDQRQCRESPLAVLIASIPPRDRPHVVGIQIGPAMGFSRTLHFHNAARLLSWLCPPHGGNTAADASTDRRFTRILTIDDLRACSADLPERIVNDWWARHQSLKHLRRS